MGMVLRPLARPTAREAAEIVGALIEEHGYATYGGNSHLFADADDPLDQVPFVGGGKQADELQGLLDLLDHNGIVLRDRRLLALQPAAGVLEHDDFPALRLPQRLLPGLQRRGISSPFPSQVRTLPDALAGRSR